MSTRFKLAVEATAEIKNAYEPGLQALSGTDESHVSAEDPRRLTGSVDIDSTLQSLYPDKPRWDYAIGHKPANLEPDEMVYWIEIHPANEGEIKAVEAKLQWLRSWLSTRAPVLDGMRREFLWLASGESSFAATDPKLRTLAAAGLQFRGRHFKIPNNAA